jgi:death-on-curing protein
MNNIEEAIYSHDKIIDNFGGGRGLRDKGALEAALNRPYATFDGIDLYQTPIEKAAALLESMAINHPFIDGNKRIAYVLMKRLLFRAGFVINASEKEKLELVLGTSKGELRFDEIKNWLQLKVQTKKV